MLMNYYWHYFFALLPTENAAIGAMHHIYRGLWLKSSHIARLLTRLAKGQPFLCAKLWEDFKML